MIRAAHAVYFTSLAVWVGGLAALTIVAAPTIFKYAPSRGAAGAIFGPTLRTFAWVELACALLLAASALFISLKDPRSWPVELIRMSLVTIMVLVLFSYAFGVYPAVGAERVRIEKLPEDDPGRARFNRLHKLSVKLVGANLLAGLALLILSAATIRSTG